MTQLQATFYIIAIIYMIVNVLILLGLGVGIFFIIKAVSDVRKKVDEKIKFVENIIHNPDEAIARTGSLLIKQGIRKARNMFKRKNNSGE